MARDLFGYIPPFLRKALVPRSAKPGRENITRLFRNPPQLKRLAELLRPAPHDPLRVVIFGVADGSEAISLLVALDPARSGAAVRLHGYDVCKDYLGHYRSNRFPLDRERVLPHGFNVEEYLRRTPSGLWELRREWRDAILCEYGDLLAEDAPPDGPYDLVVCQNVLISMDRLSIEYALGRLASLARPGGILALGGGPLDVVPGKAASLGLTPLLDDVAEIHEGWTIQRRFYDNPTRPYWALEPFRPDHPDGPIRYCTLFRKSN